MTKLWTGDDMYPIIEALGLSNASVLSLVLSCRAGSLPVLTIEQHPRVGDRFVMSPADPNKLAVALKRFRLVPIDD